MNAETFNSRDLPYNHVLIQWAREWRQKTIEDAAKRLKIEPVKIQEWEDGTSVPTVRQARKLAKFYDREFMEFFYDEPPDIEESQLLPDFRLHAGASDPGEKREILEIQRWAEAQRLNALSLFSEIQEKIPEFPEDIKATLTDDVEDIATRLRHHLDFTIESQMRLNYREKLDLPKLLQTKFEELGVMVLRNNDLAKFNVRGISVVEFPLPIIVFVSEAPGAQAFTLLHEFAHIILGVSAISGKSISKKPSSREQKIERWCNKFASAFLIPKQKMVEYRFLPDEPAESIDDAVLRQLSQEFKVSPHAMLIRLVDLGYVQAEYYWGVKLPLFRAEEAKYRRGGRAEYYGSRYISRLGQPYTKLVLEALGTGKIPFHQAADYMGISNPKHLSDIIQRFEG